MPTRYAQFGCVKGDGSGGVCFQALLKDDTGSHRFMKIVKSKNLIPTNVVRGSLLAVEMSVSNKSNNVGGVEDEVAYVGSQFVLALGDLDEGGSNVGIPMGCVVEDEDGVLDKIDGLYCDDRGRPYTDVRVVRAMVVYDPFQDEDGMKDLLQKCGVAVDGSASPDRDKPDEEVVEVRIPYSEQDEEDGGKTMAEREEEMERKEAKSRATVLTMLGDLPDEEAKAPENVLFVCKLNPVTDDEDLELIFSRFDQNAKADIVRDQETGDSLCYAFIEFSTKEQCTEAYFKMNNALVDDRRIKVDFSQSVSHIWNRFVHKYRNLPLNRMNGSNKDNHEGRGRRNDSSSSSYRQSRQREIGRDHRGEGRYRNDRRNSNDNTSGYERNYHSKNEDDSFYRERYSRSRDHDKRFERRRESPERDWDRRDRKRHKKRSSHEKSRYRKRSRSRSNERFSEDDISYEKRYKHAKRKLHDRGSHSRSSDKKSRKHKSKSRRERY